MLAASLVYAAAFISWLLSGRLQQLSLVAHQVFAQQVSQDCMHFPEPDGWREYMP